MKFPTAAAKACCAWSTAARPPPIPSAAPDFGDAWLLRQGYTLADLGWQWDAPPGGLRLYAPVATDHGQPITGLLRDDFTPVAATSDWPLGHIIVGRMGGTEYPVANPNDPRNVLTVRDTPTGPRTTIPRTQWWFVRPGAARLVPIAQGRHLDAPHGSIHLNGGFQPGRIYELVYVVKDPVVAGLGFAAVRDFVSWLKYGNNPSPAAAHSRRDRRRTSPRPSLPVHRAYALGISQCGRWLRTLLYEGFNQDEQNRMALDGILAHVGGAGRGSFNARFAQPSRDAQPMSSIFYPTDIFPFSGLPEQDPAHPHAAPQGLLDRTREQDALPKIFFSHTSFEYWGRAASLIHTTADARRDMPQDPNVRIYFFAGLQHFSGPFPPQRGTGELASQNLETPLPIRWFWRSMISNMNRWVRDGVAPPPTTIPHIADGTLVPLNKLAFPGHPRRACSAAMSTRPGIWTSGRTGSRLASSLCSRRWWAPLSRFWCRRSMRMEMPRRRASAGDCRAAGHLYRLEPPRSRPPALPTGASPSSARIFPLRKPQASAKPPATRAPPSKSDILADATNTSPATGTAVDALVRARWILPDDAPALMQQGAAEWDYATK